MRSGMRSWCRGAIIVGATIVTPLAARAQSDPTYDYVIAHSDREEMVRVPMRDGVRLSALILFPKDQPKKSLPAILIYNPYLTDGMIHGFGRYIKSFIDHGYA